MRSTILLSFLSAVISNFAFGEPVTIGDALTIDKDTITYQSGGHPDSCVKDVNVDSYLGGGTGGGAVFADVIGQYSNMHIATSGFQILDAVTCTQKTPMKIAKGYYVSKITAGMNYDMVKGPNSTATLNFSGLFTKNATFLKFVNGSRSFAKGQAVDEQSAFTSAVTFDRNSLLVKLWCAQTSQAEMNEVFQMTTSLSSIKSTFQSSGDIDASMLNSFVSLELRPCN